MVYSFARIGAALGMAASWENTGKFIDSSLGHPNFLSKGRS
jgi:hypothetical protein